MPQQCLRSSRSAATPVEAREGTDGGSAADVATAVSSTEGAPGHASTSDPVFGIGAVVSAVSSASPPPPSESPPATPTDESDADTDSPLDNAHFLSFEEWKKQNLEKSGQSPEHVGQGRAGTASAASARKHPDIGSLDSLGEEGEIEFDFGGFGGLD
ncbi:MAG: hypothetical protein INR71_06170, partial [Terriglobus roseus]|nr:hypothetical protein [Terriglobus roseus]